MIYSRGSNLRTPTLQLRGEYQASTVVLGTLIFDIGVWRSW